MDVGFNLSRREAVFLLARLIATPILSGIGIYYLVAKQFDATAIFISAVIFISLVTLQFLKNRQTSLDMNLSALGVPLGFVIVVFLLRRNPILAYLIGIALNYFALFAVVNFIQRTFDKINL